MLVHRRIHAWTQANPFKVDLTLMLSGVLFLAFPALILGGPHPALDFVLSLGIIVPLAWRRARPVLSGSITASFCLVQVLFSDMPVPADFVPLLTVYALAAYAPRWASLGGLMLAAIGCVLFILRYFGFPYISSTSEVVVYAFSVMAFEAVVLVAWTFGDLARTRRLAMEALRDHARRLEVERQQERDLAAADERTHIAREMHDIVAHSLSVIITQADGARYASAQDPEIAAKTLATIAETGRGSLREMRRLLGVLRGDELASTRPLPSLADVGALVDAVKRAGLEVVVAETGTMRRQLPPGAELTAYRVIQESLTNVLKHAGPGAQAGVDLQWVPRGLEINVHDDGRGAGADVPQSAPPHPGRPPRQAPAPASGPGAGQGQGINGMAERVALYDGTLHAAPATGGGFRVTAFIPYTEA
ncbi:sensor histidine kinase [Arthrobacter jiangjiafuii]|uniref:histidine kinase n=1 Tax=Arthrobacter jiangjiafuii TaxID=2817475 RepID=A0A975R075_9MICC|nr:histidine kinase [Arthrobacter jiangjiafuii]MBP3044996.1 sensor histidine kinase [Arthrobacter jiangjiafuii]QWC09139.1 sensor histidine kinase [Arthrobacter jiangjiafuii]